jgi:signal peptidase II
MFQDSGPLLAVTSILGVIAISIYFLSPSFAKPLMQLGLGLMLGGAIGNLIDRVSKGEVVDFLKVPNWPAFNVADSSITIGVVLILWTILFDEPEPQAETSEAS